MEIPYALGLEPLSVRVGLEGCKERAKNVSQPSSRSWQVILLSHYWANLKVTAKFPVSKARSLFALYKRWSFKSY